jgi:AraC family transcriptional regulator
VAAISSKDPSGFEVPRGLSQVLRALPGVHAVRVIERPRAAVAPHAHDWPVLSLYVMGACTRHFDGVSPMMAGPGAVLHPPGRFHHSSVGAAGFEQIDIEFDPSWLRLPNQDALGCVQHWRGGRIGDAARQLAGLWAGESSSDVLNDATKRFIQLASSSEPTREPSWLRRVVEHIETDSAVTTDRLARDLDLHPAWLAQAYRTATGEGLQHTRMRKRVERAALLLRNTTDGAAEIALAAGFCDQSHMNRCFKALLGRTPTQVRAERV